MQGVRTQAGARQEGGGAEGGTETVGQAQGGRLRTVNRVARLVGKPGKVVLPAEPRADVSAQGLWKRRTTAIFNIRISNLNEGSYLRMTPEKALAKAEK